MVMRYFGSKAGLFAAASTTPLQVPDLQFENLIIPTVQLHVERPSRHAGS